MEIGKKNNKPWEDRDIYLCPPDIEQVRERIESAMQEFH